MPFDLNAYLRNAGDTLSGADLNALFDAAYAIVEGGAAQGLEDIDIPDDAAIPNAVLDATRTYWTLQWRPSQRDVIGWRENRVPGTTIYIPVRSELVAYDYQLAGEQFDIAIARDGRVIDARDLLWPQANVIDRITLGAPETFEIGQTFTAVYDTAAVLGADLLGPLATRYIHVDFHFRMLD